MTIIDKLNALAKTVADESVGGAISVAGETASADAVEAIMAGPLLPDGRPTAQWKQYMQRFADTPAQLDRLTLQDDKKDQFTVRRSLAYIVANAVCGAISTTQTEKNVAVEAIEV